MQNTRGNVKWFDTSKGYGFVTVDDDGGDVLLHANVLRNYGRGSVAEGALIEFDIQKTGRGRQVATIYNIESVKEEQGGEPLNFGTPDLVGLLVEPARVKWFDKSKGFGFANIFKSSEDIFLHMEILRNCGFSDLQPGEAIAIKVVDGPRGKMAGAVFAWDEKVI